jgi:hypothetical protein
MAASPESEMTLSGRLSAKEWLHFSSNKQARRCLQLGRLLPFKRAVLGGIVHGHDNFESSPADALTLSSVTSCELLPQYFSIANFVHEQFQAIRCTMWTLFMPLLSAVVVDRGDGDESGLMT